MGRSKGSLSTPTANEIAKDMETLGCKNQKYNIYYLRLVELLVCYRVAEELCKYSSDVPIEERKVKVEIPLFGELTILPRQFHERHRLTDSPSVHLDFEFTPSSGFKVDMIKVFSEKNYDIAEIFSTLYSDRLKELYDRLRSDNS